MNVFPAYVLDNAEQCYSDRFDTPYGYSMFELEDWMMDSESRQLCKVIGGGELNKTLSRIAAHGDPNKRAVIHFDWPHDENKVMVLIVWCTEASVQSGSVWVGVSLVPRNTAPPENLTEYEVRRRARVAVNETRDKHRPLVRATVFEGKFSNDDEIEEFCKSLPELRYGDIQACDYASHFASANPYLRGFAIVLCVLENESLVYFIPSFDCLLDGNKAQFRICQNKNFILNKKAPKKLLKKWRVALANQLFGGDLSKANEGFDGMF